MSAPPLRRTFFGVRSTPFIGMYVQLDWPSETDTLNINLSQDREDYGGFEYTNENLSARRIQLCRNPSSIFIFGGIFEE